MDKNIWTISHQGQGASSWVKHGGIPSIHPAWEKNTNICMSGIASDGKNLYFSTIEDNIDFSHCLSLQTGDIVWRKEISYENDGYRIAINRDWVFVCRTVHDRHTGEQITDLVSFLGEEDIGDMGGIATTIDGFIYETQKPKQGLFYLNVKERSGEYVAEGIARIIQGDDESVLYGLRENRLVCFDIESQSERWSVEIPLDANGELFIPSRSPYLVEDRLYLHVNKETLWCIDATTGEFVWKNGPDQQEGELTWYSPGLADRGGACKEHLILMRNGWKDGWGRCFSTADGTLVWEKPLVESALVLIAGDLLFTRDDNALIALDCYTGELVWQADRPMPSSNMICAGNSIVYTTTMGETRCYRWEDEYVSPNRPT